tara:strand:+ start:245 stop:421 length:177 start_codon:yes stop_codon:yes gene_type:complete
MTVYFAVSLGLSPIEIAAIVISGVGFIIMFGIASAKGDFQGLIKTTLENDATNRENKK